MSERSDKIRSFFEFLWKLDRKGFAELRRSLSNGPGMDMKAIRYVEQFAASEPRAWNSQMYYLAAGLFCLVERPLEPGSSAPTPRESNLGENIARLYLDKEKSGSIEHRFVRLLDADEEQLTDRLRQMVTLLHGNDITIGWEQLLFDLCIWHNEKRHTQHRWAKSFYLKSAPEPQALETPGGNT
jgi:CRISPR system Cascade subunit CasB